MILTINLVENFSVKNYTVKSGFTAYNKIQLINGLPKCLLLLKMIPLMKILLTCLYQELIYSNCDFHLWMSHMEFLSYHSTSFHVWMGHMNSFPGFSGGHIFLGMYLCLKVHGLYKCS